MLQAGFLGDVFEGAVSLLVIESDQRVAAGFVPFDRRAVDQHHVEAAIVIAIEQACAAAGRIDDVMGFRGRNMNGGEANVFSDVFEGGSGREAAAVLLGGRRELGGRNKRAARVLARSLPQRGRSESQN